jgi:N-methylhydantoinase A
MCAFGMLMADFHHHFVRTIIRSLRNGVEHHIQCAVEDMTREAEKHAEGMARSEELSMRAALELRYSGQFHEVEIPLAELDAAKIRESFHRRHATLYGYSDPGSEVELVNVHVYSVSRTTKPARGAIAKDRGIDQALKEKRNIFFQGRFVTTPVYDGSKLGAGASVDGPCLIEYPDTAVVVQPYCRARIDTKGNLRMAVDL